ncbi:MAG: C25 family cysteine peptidase [Anaerolineae bacterium]
MKLLRLILIIGLLLSPRLAMPAAANSMAASDSPDMTIHAENDGVLLNLHVPAFRVQDVTLDGAAYQQIVLEDENWGRSGQAGAPSLPERGLMVAVPPTGDVSLQVLDTKLEPVAGQFHLAPAATPAQVEGADGPQIVERWAADRSAYASADWTPAAQAEITQEGWFRGYRFVRIALHPFQYNPANGSLRAATAMQVRVHFADPAPAASAAPDPLFQTILYTTFANAQQAAGWQTRPEPVAAPPEAVARAVSTDPWVKITANADGLYRVTYASLQAAGVATSVLDSLNPRTFRLLDAGQEQAIHVTGEADNVFNTTDTLLFYGRRNTAPHTDDNNVYWLTWGGANGMRMATQSVAPAGAALAQTLLTTAHWEENLEYKQQRPFVDWLQPVLYDSWFSGQVLSSKTVTFANLAVNAASTVAPTLAVWMAGDKQTTGNYRVDFTLNSSVTQSKTWTSTRVLDGSLALPAGALVNGSNTLLLQPINLTGLANNDFTVWLDWLRLTYPYNGQYLSGATFSNPTAGLWRYEITAVPAATPWLLNVSSPQQPKLLLNAAASGGGPYTLSWQQSTTATDSFIVIPDSEVRQPTAISVYTASTLLDTTQQVDYLLITHPSLLAAVQPLVAMHTAEGLTVRVVNVQDIYDLFSDGSLSADAIHDYLAFAYSNYQTPAPMYVLLVGDASMNYRGYVIPSVVTPRVNLVPTFLGGFDAWSGSAVSDNGFVRVQGNDLLGEMVISRLPVNTVAETNVVVSKITQYASTFPPARALNTLWISDNPDNDNPAFGTQFYLATEETLAPLLPQFSTDRIYFCTPSTNTCPSDPWVYTDIIAARAAVVNKWNEGHLLIHYTGHGGITTWAHEQLFRVYWTNQLTNATALPFLLVSSCTNGYFVDPRYDGLDEGLLRASGRGTIGGFTGVTFDTLHPQTVLLTNFVDAVMNDRITQIGVAATVARARTFAQLSYPDNERSAVGHSLTGDPALALLQPVACANGDVNCDGVYDIYDIQLVAAAWGTTAWSSTFTPRTDVVQDGVIDINDIVAIATLWHTPVP